MKIASKRHQSGLERCSYKLELLECYKIIAVDETSQCSNSDYFAVCVLGCLSGFVWQMLHGISPANSYPFNLIFKSLEKFPWHGIYAFAVAGANALSHGNLVELTSCKMIL